MEQKREYDEHFKIMLLGDNCVGKSCLLQRYFRDHIDTYSYFDTYGVEQEIKLLKTHNKIIKLRIWDASGAPQLQDLIVKAYFHLADGAFICFDVTNPVSFENTQKYIDRFKASKKHAPIILIGCKSDLVLQRRVGYEEAEKLAYNLGIPYIEVSALKKINVNEVFEQITQRIYFSVQRDKIKPALEECYSNYLKVYTQKNHSGFFSTLTQNLNKEGPLKDEYKSNLEKLFQSTDPFAMAEFCLNTLELIDKAELVYKTNNPFLSSIFDSPLSTALQQTLNLVCDIPAEMTDLCQLKELIREKKVTQVQYRMVSI